MNIQTLILILVFFSTTFIAQTALDEDLITTHKKEIKIHRKHETNAEHLVADLIKDKYTEQEKFDAIFNWVILNIKYDYNEFYSPTASIPRSITRILKTKRTICLGYSNLMDTLCSLAGITNVTVFGYAKDDYFDVNDSIYVHNHAWNAVKLNNLWYLYDATWSIGESGYEIKSTGKWIRNWLKKHPEKLKKKKLRNKYRFKLKSMCSTDEVANSTAYYYKQRFFNHVHRKIISKLPIRSRKVFITRVNKDFYLSEPRLFGITHIPDSPTWNLSRKQAFRDLETDSAFYYFTDSVLKNQLREGKECVECDAYVQLSAKEKLKDLNLKSKSFNKHNQFITAYCEEAIGKINALQCYAENDSLQKIQFLDSARSSYNKAKSNLQQCKKNLAIMIMLLKNKDATKMKLLLSENKLHTLFVSQKVKTTLKHTRSYNKMLSQGNAHATNYLKAAKKTAHFNTHIKTGNLKPVPEKTILSLKNNLAKKTKQLDSIALLIISQKRDFDSLLTNQSLNIWQQVQQHDSIIKPYERGAELRRFGKDNYKKIIVDIRKKIGPFEKRYTNSLNNIIYTPAEKIFNLFKSITQSIKRKRSLQNDCLKLTKELVKAQQTTITTLENFRTTIIEDCRYDFCWIAGNYSNLGTMQYGLTYLKLKQDNALTAIKIENSTERYRHYGIIDAAKNGYRSGNTSLTYEIREIKQTIKQLDKYKKALVKPKKKIATKK